MCDIYKRYVNKYYKWRALIGQAAVGHVRREFELSFRLCLDPNF